MATMFKATAVTGTSLDGVQSRFRRARLVLCVVLAIGAFGAAAEQASASAVITNGTISLGVFDQGHLNYQSVGVTYVPTGNDGTSPGCLCEGWGAGTGGADLFSGDASVDLGGVNNIDLVSFTSTASTAVSVVTIDGKLKVTQDYHPFAGSTDLYEATVTLENIGLATLPDTRYTRAMDWDIGPTEFNEFVTIQRGTPAATALLFSHDDGFESPNPFSPRSEIVSGTTNTNFTDSGPTDHGALFDFGFGSLDAGATKSFNIYYGAAGTEIAANAAVSAAAAEVYSYGQPSSTGGADLGVPNTFIFAFKGVGGTVLIPPNLTLSPGTDTNEVGDPHTVTATLKNDSGAAVSGAKILFAVTGPNTANGSGTTDTEGKASFTYAGTNPGNDTITACHDANNSSTCDPGESTASASKTYVSSCPPGTTEAIRCPSDPARLALTRSGVVSVPITCTLDSGCGGRLSLRGILRGGKANAGARRARTLPLGSRAYKRIRVGKTRVVSLRLSRKTARRVRRIKRLRVQAVTREKLVVGRQQPGTLKVRKLGTFRLDTR